MTGALQCFAARRPAWGPSITGMTRLRRAAGTPLCGQAREWPGGEDHLDGHLEVLRDPQCEEQTRTVLTSLEIADGLRSEERRVGKESRAGGSAGEDK